MLNATVCPPESNALDALWARPPAHTVKSDARAMNRLFRFGIDLRQFMVILFTLLFDHVLQPRQDRLFEGAPV
jgi:hypothetical protein